MERKKKIENTKQTFIEFLVCAREYIFASTISSQIEGIKGDWYLRICDGMIHVY